MHGPMNVKQLLPFMATTVTRTVRNVNLYVRYMQCLSRLMLNLAVYKVTNWFLKGHYSPP